MLNWGVVEDHELKLGKSKLLMCHRTCPVGQVVNPILAIDRAGV